jgi:hypothetical protein
MGMICAVLPETRNPSCARCLIRGMQIPDRALISHHRCLRRGHDLDIGDVQLPAPMPRQIVLTIGRLSCPSIRPPGRRLGVQSQDVTSTVPSTSIQPGWGCGSVSAADSALARTSFVLRSKQSPTVSEV